MTYVGRRRTRSHLPPRGFHSWFHVERTGPSKRKGPLLRAFLSSGGELSCGGRLEWFQFRGRTCWRRPAGGQHRRHEHTSSDRLRGRVDARRAEVLGLRAIAPGRAVRSSSARTPTGRRPAQLRDSLLRPLARARRQVGRLPLPMGHDQAGADRLGGSLSAASCSAPAWMRSARATPAPRRAFSQAPPGTSSPSSPRRHCRCTSPGAPFLRGIGGRRRANLDLHAVNPGNTRASD